MAPWALIWPLLFYTLLRFLRLGQESALEVSYDMSLPLGWWTTHQVLSRVSPHERDDVFPLLQLTRRVDRPAATSVSSREGYYTYSEAWSAFSSSRPRWRSRVYRTWLMFACYPGLGGKAHSRRAVCFVIPSYPQAARYSFSPSFPPLRGPWPLSTLYPIYIYIDICMYMYII